MSELQELYSYLTQQSTIGTIFAAVIIFFLFGLVFCRQEPIMRHGWPAYLLSVVWVSIVPVAVGVLSFLMLLAADLLAVFIPRAVALLIFPIWLFTWLSATVWLFCTAVIFPLEFALRYKDVIDGHSHST